MKNFRMQWVVRRAVCLASVPLVAAGLLLAQAAPPAPPPAQQLSPQQLDTMVAPVALYPDNLLGQILAASTYPLEIAEAAQWQQQNGNLQGPQLVEAARHQNWDPSVQALVVFPDVLGRLASDIRWTTDLGNAFLAQQADVMNAVQRMRAQAMASGKLRSNPEQTVTTEMQGNQSAVDIQPANPEVVYVPYYNPEYIWGPPAYGYYPPWDYADIGFGLGYGFGPGIYIGGFFGGLGWGGWGWGLNWFHCSLFGNPFFFNHYGYGWHGFGAGGVWAHDAGHRLGVAYSNSALNRRYGAASAASARSAYASSAASRYSGASRASAGQAGGWNRFGSGAQNSYRGAPAYGGSNAYRSSPSYGRSSGAYGGSSGYRSAPSYSYGGHGGYSSGYSRSSGSVHSYGGSVHSYGGSVHSSGGSSHSSGGSSHSSGGGFHGGGGHGGGGHGGGGHR